MGQRETGIKRSALSRWLFGIRRIDGKALYECSIFWIMRRPPHARARADQALALAVQAGDELTRYLALAQIAWLSSAIEHRAEYEAVDVARTALARFVRRRGGPGIGLLSGLAWACLAADDTVQARDALQQLWPLSQGADIARNWACWAALLAALEQRPRAALALLGFSDAANERAAPGSSREALDARMAERAEALARDALNGEREGGGGPEVMAALKARGAGLTEVAMAALALDRLDA